jgi:intein/homing endonuclease
MKGTLFSADFVKDSEGNLRLLELNTDTGFIDQELMNFNFTEFNQLLIENDVTVVDLIYKPYIHARFIDILVESITNNVPNVTEINHHKENTNSIYPNSILDSEDRFILRICYDESSIFDSEYCKNRLNVYNLFVDNEITNHTAAYYYQSTDKTYNTLTKEINNVNIPDATIKSIIETRNPISFVKLGNPDDDTNDRWDNFLNENSSEDVLIEQYHTHPSMVDENNHITSIRHFGIVYGENLSIIGLHSYKISSIFELPTTLENYVDETKYTNKIPVHHYYEFVSNFFKNDSSGILSTHEILMSDDTWSEIKDVNVGDSVKSYYIEGLPKNENQFDAINWTSEGNTLPIGSYVTSSEVVYKDITNLKYGAVIEMVVDNDSLFSGLTKRFLVYDSTNNMTKFKFISEINHTTDFLFDVHGNIVKVDDINFYTTTQPDLNFIEIDVEDSDTYMINGSSAFNTLVSHNAPCFVGGTNVLLENGLSKNIEDIKIGDTILSYNFKTNENVLTKVLNIFSKKVKKIVEYEFVNGGILKATPDHPLYVKNKGWCSYSNELSNSMYSLEGGVKKIELNDVVKFYNSENILTGINVIEEENVVYNLSDIEKHHNYFANNVLVHNRSCFISGTKIITKYGEKNIEDVKVGDFVLSFNEELKITEYKRVINTSSPIHDDLVKYTFSNGTSIISTYDHPYYINGLTLASYKPAWTNERYDLPSTVIDINVGDSVTLSDGNVALIEKIEKLEKNKTQTYNISVEDNRNFFANNILVHNK